MAGITEPLVSVFRSDDVIPVIANAVVVACVVSNLGSVDVAVVVARMFPTVSCVPVAMRAVPSVLDTMIELFANVVEFVPPFDTGSVPVIVARVVVACHVGTPLTRARTNPFVPCVVVASCPVPLPRSSVLAWMFVQPVPP